MITHRTRPKLEFYTCGPLASHNTEKRSNHRRVELISARRVLRTFLSLHDSLPPFFFSFLSGNRSVECVAIDGDSSANVIDHRVATSAAWARTRILSTVDRVIARISALDCDGRDWASPREAVLSRVALRACVDRPFFPTRAHPHDLATPSVASTLLRSFRRPAWTGYPAPTEAAIPFSRLLLTLISRMRPVPSRMARTLRGTHTALNSHVILFHTSITREDGSRRFRSPSDSICRSAESFCWMRFVTCHHSARLGPLSAHATRWCRILDTAWPSRYRRSSSGTYSLERLDFRKHLYLGLL